MRHGKYRFLVGALIVPLALYGVFVLSPYLQAFQLSFTNWNGVDSAPEFTGFDNYVKLLDDPLFLAGLRHNGLMLLVVPLAVIVVALALAAATKGTRVYRVVYFFPSCSASRSSRCSGSSCTPPTAGCSTARCRRWAWTPGAGPGWPSRTWRCGA
ncbi:hypothetical protein ACFQZ4_35845 [Catellatospora coxensis]